MPWPHLDAQPCPACAQLIPMHLAEHRGQPALLPTATGAPHSMCAGCMSASMSASTHRTWPKAPLYQHLTVQYAPSYLRQLPSKAGTTAALQDDGGNGNPHSRDPRAGLPRLTVRLHPLEADEALKECSLALHTGYPRRGGASCTAECRVEALHDDTHVHACPLRLARQSRT